MVALPGFIAKMFDANARDIARYQVIVNRINALEGEIEKCTDDQLRERTQKLREQVQSEYARQREAAEPSWEGLTDQKRREADRHIYDPILDAALPEAFALAREASKRTLGMRHYDVQLMGGIALHEGRISEMKTGEGKTLVATAPIFLNALLGKGVHLVTANDYLSKRDAVWNGPVYHLLGMSVGIIQGQSPETGDEGGSYLYNPDYHDEDARYEAAETISRAEAYACDITYGTNNEYGFDYLRDNMSFNKDDLVQGELHYAIVDEVDSILIDEARTPLIISGQVEQSTAKYYQIDQIVRNMKRGIDDPKTDKENPDADKNNPNIHYVVDEKAKTATITDAGVSYVEKQLKALNIVQGDVNLSDNNELMHYLGASMKAHGVFRKDIDYVVKDSDPNDDEGPEIIIVDENTGRLMFGRRYSDGLHQAIEAKEQVEVKNESQTLATITFQNYFRLYSKLAGMTGTAKTEEDEFRKIYALDVVQIPTNRPVVRMDHPDMIYKVEEHKMRGISSEILRVFCKQQPILVGTRSIEMSERVSRRLRPVELSTLCLAEICREKLENNKTLSAEDKKTWTGLLNKKMEGPKPLLVGQLKPLCKALNLDEDPLSPKNMNEIARFFQIQDSGLELLEEALTHGIPHNILNAKFHEKEAIIIAEAGRKNAVTIATNMAGRGVDILLGGKHIKQELPPIDGSLKSLQSAGKAAEKAAVAVVQPEVELDPDESLPGEEEDYRRNMRSSVLNAVTSGGLSDEEHKRAADEVRTLGGLYILGTERHESRRIDNQLRGRSGRQGDPGESRFYVSLEDELWRLFGDRANHPVLRTWEEHMGMDNKILSTLIQRAQKKVEEHYFESRKHVLNYDDVMNRQRELIYKERRRILEGVNLKETILNYMELNIESAVNHYCALDTAPAEWPLDELFRDLDEYFMLVPILSVDDLKGKTREEIIEFITEHVKNVYESREQEMDLERGEGNMRELERWMALRAVNDRWMEHLANMDYLREGIHLRSYEQKDPLLIYQKEAFDEFERMQQAIQDDMVRNIFRIQIAREEPAPIQFIDPVVQLPPSLPKYSKMQDIDEPTNIRTNKETAAAGPARRADGAPPDWKGGRNDPCWCGSGKKYKKCHGQ